MGKRLGAARPGSHGGTPARARGIAYALPSVVFVVCFLVIPSLLLGLTSLWESAFFETTIRWNLDQYTDALSDPTVVRTLVRSLVTAAITAAATTVIAFPVAFYLRFTQGTRRLVVLGIVVTALFSSYLVRIYAWRTILGREGAINWALQQVGLIDQPSLVFFYNRFAVILTLVHIFVPFATLMILAGLERLDRDLMEASKTLGASRRSSFMRVVLPLAAPGIFAAFAFTFVLSAGDFVTPQLVGGTSGSMVGQLIATQFVQGGDYSSGAAVSFLVLFSLALCLAAIYLAGRAIYSTYR